MKNNNKILKKFNSFPSWAKNDRLEGICYFSKKEREKNPFFIPSDNRGSGPFYFTHKSNIKKRDKLYLNDIKKEIIVKNIYAISAHPNMENKSCYQPNLFGKEIWIKIFDIEDNKYYYKIILPKGYYISYYKTYLDLSDIFPIKL